MLPPSLHRTAFAVQPDNFMLINTSSDSGIKAIDFGHSIHFKVRKVTKVHAQHSQVSQ